MYTKYQAAQPGPALRRPGRPLARATGPGRAGPGRLVFCISLVHVLYIIVYIWIYLNIFWYVSDYNFWKGYNEAKYSPSHFLLHFIKCVYQRCLQIRLGATIS